MAKILTTEAYFNPLENFIYYSIWHHTYCFLLN